MGKSFNKQMDIFDIFRSAANPEKAAPMSAYMRGRFTYLGLPASERKKLILICNNIYINYGIYAMLLLKG